MVKILSQIIFFFKPSWPNYFFPLKIQHQIIYLGKNHAPPLLLLKTALFGLKQVLSNFYAIGFL
jgi:hypothetical protein